VAEFLEALHATVSTVAGTWEIIVVDDGSTDDSAAEAQRVATRCRVRLIRLSRNFGKESAIQAGLDAARGDCVAILDADFQHPLDLLPEMVARWRAGADMVYGVQVNRQHESLLRRVGARVFYRWLARYGSTAIPADAGDFRLLDRGVVQALRALPEHARFMKGLYAWVGFRTEPLPFTAPPRRHGTSRFAMRGLAGLAVTGITSFSVAPLRLVTAVGLLISGLAMAMGVWVVVERLFLGQSIPGFATLAAAIFFLSGIQLLALGVVGEYVGRVFEETKRRPTYVVAADEDYSGLAAGATRAVGRMPLP
jgi:glycosyltransferase involved in cell wall biosynthesis